MQLKPVFAMKQNDFFVTALAIVSNALILAMALINNQSITDILWVYWMQGIIVALFSYRRIKRIPSVDTEGIKTNLAKNPTPNELQHQMATILLIVVLFFHFVYAIFLLSFRTFVPELQAPSMLSLLCGAAMFAAYHFVQNKKAEDNDKTRVVKLAEIPVSIIVRLLPIHITIIFTGFLVIVFGGLFTIAIVFFVVLKTLLETRPAFLMKKIKALQEKAQQAAAK